MKVIDEQTVKNQINQLKTQTDTVLKNLNSLHLKEKMKKLNCLTNTFSEIFLDLYQLKNFKVDFNNDPLFLEMYAIRENFHLLIH